MEEKEKKYFEVLVDYGNKNSKKFYISAYDAVDAQNIVKKFKAFSNVANSKIIGAFELSFEDYSNRRAEIERRKNELLSYDVTLSILSENDKFAEVKHFYIRANDEKDAKNIITKIIKKKNIISAKILDIKAISYDEYRTCREEDCIKFFKVVARCGHVGDRMFYPVNFYVIAKDKREAAERVKKFPRVKKSSATSGIEHIEEINKMQYEEGIIEMQNNPFLHHNKLTENEEADLLEQIEALKQIVPEYRQIKKKRKGDAGEFTEEQLRNKRYKRDKKKYKEDGGLYVDKQLKHAKILGVEDNV